MASGWDAENYSQNFTFVPAYGRELVDILRPEKDEKILDLGCGTGVLTSEIATQCREVIGVDRDANMITHAKRAYPHIQFLRRDAGHLNLAQSFDAVFSNAALHWMKLEEVFPEVAKVLNPSGRLVVEMGGIGNIAAIEKAIDEAFKKLSIDSSKIEKPWHFRTPAETASLLERNHFEVRYMHLYDRPTHLPSGTGGLLGWMKMFAGSFLKFVPLAEHERFLNEIEKAAKPALWKDGAWYADYRRFHFVAIKKQS